MSPSSNPTSLPSPTRRVKFVAVDTSRGGLPVKRKQVQQACSACRRKKRRCIHAQDSWVEEPATNTSTTTAASQADSSNDQLSPPKPASDLARDGNQTVLQGKRLSGGSELAATADYGEPEIPSTGPSPTVEPPSASGKGPVVRSRFYGDLNPEGMFMEATGTATTRGGTAKGDVGIWLASSSAANGSSQFITARPPAVTDRFLLPFVREHCLCRLPPEEDFAKLKAIFVRRIHPIFPIIPIPALDGPLSDPITVVLRQLVALAAGTASESALYLRAGDVGSPLLSPMEFSETISSAVRAILETSIITDRVLHIRALAMLSLYTQPTCPEEADLPAQLSGRAIHHIQTLGLHLMRYDGPNSEDLENLFCALWAIDRINGAMYGRPCIMHERDIGANLEECIKKRAPCFRLLLSVVQWLDHVIELYRPGPSAEASVMQKVAYIDLPVLEAMIVEADAMHVRPSLIATIEAFYHAVIILSCRLTRPGTVSAASTLPPPSANARRSLAADRIACSVPRDCLSPVPFVPYAVSLALSVEYRKMRHSRLPMFRARAMKSFKRNSQLLRRYGDYFWSANVLAGLSERVLREMERAATTLNGEPTPIAPDENNLVCTTATGDQISAGPNDQMFINSTTMEAASGMENMVDFSVVDPISGQDIFGHIDPSFNLNAVEDALEANLDIGLPLNLGDWGQFANWENDVRAPATR